MQNLIEICTLLVDDLYGELSSVSRSPAPDQNSIYESVPPCLFLPHLSIQN